MDAGMQKEALLVKLEVLFLHFNAGTTRHLFVDVRMAEICTRDLLNMKQHSGP
jgi:hypothetical protein